MRAECRYKGWKRYSTLPKTRLKSFINQKIRMEAATKIQRWVCRRRSVNQVDVFSGEPIQWWRTSKKLFYVTHTHKLYTFVPKTLLEYMLTSGNFSNPYTREAFSNDDLRRLSSLLKTFDDGKITYQIHYDEPPLVVTPSSFDIVQTRDEITRVRAEQRARERLVEMLYDECESLIHRICYQLQMHKLHEVHLNLRPEFIQCYRSLFQLDRDKANHIRVIFIDMAYKRMNFCDHAYKPRVENFLVGVIRFFSRILRDQSTPENLIQANVMDNVISVISAQRN